MPGLLVAWRHTSSPTAARTCYYNQTSFGKLPATSPLKWVHRPSVQRTFLFAKPYQLNKNKTRSVKNNDHHTIQFNNNACSTACRLIYKTNSSGYEIKNNLLSFTSHDCSRYAANVDFQLDKLVRVIHDTIESILITVNNF